MTTLPPQYISPFALVQADLVNPPQTPDMNEPTMSESLKKNSLYRPSLVLDEKSTVTSERLNSTLNPTSTKLTFSS